MTRRASVRCGGTPFLTWRYFILIFFFKESRALSLSSSSLAGCCVLLSGRNISGKWRYRFPFPIWYPRTVEPRPGKLALVMDAPTSGPPLTNLWVCVEKCGPFCFLSAGWEKYDSYATQSSTRCVSLLDKKGLSLKLPCFQAYYTIDWWKHASRKWLWGCGTQATWQNNHRHTHTHQHSTCFKI